MKLTKTASTDRYGPSNGIAVDVTKDNRGYLTFKIIWGGRKELSLEEEELEALIDLYYEVRPDAGCRRAWKREACNSYDDHVWDTICKRCGSES